MLCLIQDSVSTEQMERNVFGNGVLDSIVTRMHGLTTTDPPSRRISDPRSSIQAAQDSSSASVTHRHRNHRDSPPSSRPSCPSRYSVPNDMQYRSPLARNERPMTNSRDIKYRAHPFCVYCRHVGHLLNHCERLNAKHRRMERLNKYRSGQFSVPTDYGFLKNDRNRFDNDKDDFCGGSGGIDRLESARPGGMRIFIRGGSQITSQKFSPKPPPPLITML